MSIRVHQSSTPEFLQKVVQTRPFISQLDVVFTDSEELGGLLSALQASYYRSTVTFTEVFSAFDAKNSTLAFTIGSQDDWSIDHRAILTLSLTRNTYECLGIVGTPLKSPWRSDMFLVTLDLHDSSRQSVRTKDCLRQWDARRAEAGKSGWTVLLSSPLPSGVPTQEKLLTGPIVQVSHGVHIPSQTLPSIKSEDAHEDLLTLFEWVGLASLGSQRLHAHDAVNSYVASCPFPASWCIGSLTHARWTGLLTPSFVQSVLDTCLRGAGGMMAVTATPASRERKGVWTVVASKEDPLRHGSPKTDWILAEYSK